MTKRKTVYVIEVTSNDIRLGHRDKAATCPVARAIKRAINRTVLITHKNCFYGSKYVGCSLPETACEFIQEFDSVKTVAPITFKLDLEAPCE